MDATGVVPKTGEQTGGERNVQASSECEPRKSSYNLPIRPIRHLLDFVLRGRTVVRGKVSSRGEGRRDSSRIGEVESRENGVDERLLGYRDRACGAIALQKHAEYPFNFSQTGDAIFCAYTLHKSSELLPRAYYDELSTQKPAATKSQSVQEFLINIVGSSGVAVNLSLSM